MAKLSACRLDLTVEALVLEPRFAPLAIDADLDAGRRHLADAQHAMRT